MRKKSVLIVAMMLAVMSGCAGGKSAEPTLAPTEAPATATPVPDSFDVVAAATTQEYVNLMGVGWNLGNSLDSANTGREDHMKAEVAWGNPIVVQNLIKNIKAQGFKTIRVPVSYVDHMEEDGLTIKTEWLDRVQQVVDWCVEEDLFIILNIHHEDSWLTKASTDYDGVMKRYTSLWNQISERFGDYNEKLIFESMNEIGFDDLGTEKGCELISKINAEFVKLVRNSGKRNAERYLLLAGYWTDVDRTCTAEYTVPEDDRIMVSVHYYSPSSFAIADITSTWGYQKTWGTEEDLAYLKGQFEKLKNSFVDKGIPVIVGEYGVIDKDKDEEDRIYWFECVTKTALEYGCCPVVWDNGELIHRFKYEWKDPELGETLKKYMAK
ncbi:MAG: glycoside hydrolase family 5 protein [Lachnospiraceae bacterium]|nr:glycoside hydrolase family 5 protein [Lachnospiraceae bacterium]